MGGLFTPTCTSEVVTKSTKEFRDNNAKLVTLTSVTSHWLLLVQLVKTKLLVLRHRVKKQKTVKYLYTSSAPKKVNSYCNQY